MASGKITKIPLATFKQYGSINNTVKTGLYYCSAQEGGPGSEIMQWGTMLVIGGNGGITDVRQVWFPNSRNVIYTRYYREGSWSDWVAINSTS